MATVRPPHIIPRSPQVSLDFGVVRSPYDSRRCMLPLFDLHSAAALRLHCDSRAATLSILCGCANVISIHKTVGQPQVANAMPPYGRHMVAVEPNLWRVYGVYFLTANLEIKTGNETKPRKPGLIEGLLEMQKKK